VATTQLTITQRNDGVTDVRGEIDGGAAEELGAALERRPAPLRLDLTGVSFINSSGLRVLIRERHRRGEAFTIIEASTCVRRLFQLAGAAHLLPSLDPPCVGDRRGGPASNASAPDDRERAADQLYDELMARTWALHEVLATPAFDARRPAIQTCISSAVAHHIAELSEPSATNCPELRRLLWPTADVPPSGHPWWSTPLGRLVGGVDGSEDRTARSAIASRGIG
jgi:anti-sigma B factor antagonist